jgi:SAM-dependent methyltransferase
VPRFVCPECRGRASSTDGALSCLVCGYCFEVRDGIYRFLTPARAEAAAPFQRQYRLVRQCDGYRSSSPDYYRMLPSVARDDPHAGVWRLRRESYEHLQRHALPDVWRGPVRILDLGAGSGWLSHRLAASGHALVAVDRADDEADGLGACRYYPVSFTAVQADFDALPFEPGQFDVVVFDGSLHYAPDPARTLREACRMLTREGALVVMDSPMFERDDHGQAMVADQLRSIEADCGIDAAVRPGAGFLTFAGLDRIAGSMGLRARFIPSRGALRWRLGRRLARLRLGRSPAAFGVWVAR